MDGRSDLGSKFVYSESLKREFEIEVIFYRRNNKNISYSVIVVKILVTRSLGDTIFKLIVNYTLLGCVRL